MRKNVRIPKRGIKKTKEKNQNGKKCPDRIFRGRISRYVQDRHDTKIETLGEKIDPSFTSKDKTWLMAMIQRREKDGLIEIRNHYIRLPKP